MRFIKLAALAAAVALLVSSLAQAHNRTGRAHSASVSTSSITVGQAPWGVAADPSTGTVYVSNEYSNTVSVINESTNAVTATIPVGSDPQGLAVDPTTDTIYVTDFGAGSVSVIDGATNSVTDTITGVGDDPNSVAVDAATDTVYVGTYFSSTVVVINGSTNTITASIPISGANIHDVVVDPSTDTVYASAYNLGYVAVIDTKTNTVSGHLNSICGPDGMADDATLNLLWVAQNYCVPGVLQYAAGTSGPDDVISEMTRQHSAPGYMAAIPGSDAFASLASSNAVVVLASTGQALGTVRVGNNPEMLDVDPTTDNVYVADFGTDTVTTFHW